MADFQTAVYSRQAPGWAGDFASDNPREFYPAGPGGLVAGASGVTVGNFAWTSPTSIDWDSGATILNSYGSGPVAGIVHRQNVGQITTYLAKAGLTIPQGNAVSLLTGGDIWLANSGSGLAVPGMKAYANYLTGAVTFAATGSPTTAGATLSTISAGTAATFTGSITNGVLTASAVSNTIFPGAVLSGGTVATGTVVIAQLTGTVTGGAGTYAVSPSEQTVASASLTATPNVLDTTGGTVTGTIVIGSTVVSVSTGITGTVVGMGVYSAYATGKWVLAPAPGITAAGAATTSTIVTASNVETKWYAVSSGAQNEVVRCSSHVLG